MSKSDAYETALLANTFNNSNIADIGDATGIRASSTAGSLYVALHTADPGETGTQATSECTYGSYARQGVARSGAGWTVTGNSVSPASDISFPEASSGSETATHFSVGVASSGSTVILYYGTLTPNIVISTGVTPKIKNTSTITES